MVIELGEVQFGVKSYAYDFRPNLHDTKFNYHFFTPILKLHSFIFVNISILFLFFHFHFVGQNKGCDFE